MFHFKTFLNLFIYRCVLQKSNNFYLSLKSVLARVAGVFSAERALDVPIEY